MMFRSQFGLCVCGPWIIILDYYSGKTLRTCEEEEEQSELHTVQLCHPFHPAPVPVCYNVGGVAKNVTFQNFI